MIVTLRPLTRGTNRYPILDIVFDVDVVENADRRSRTGRADGNSKVTIGDAVFDTEILLEPFGWKRMPVPEKF